MTVRALVVGSLVMDLSFRVPKRPEAGEVIIAETFGRFRGGKGYNQAVALARLGAEVTMVGAVGDDSFGHEFIDSLEREGVDASRVQTLPDTYTAVAVPIVTPDGDVGFVHAPGANHELSAGSTSDIPPCDILFVQGEIPSAASLSACRAVTSRGGMIFLNPAPVHDLPHELIDFADVICPNEVEAVALAGSAGAASSNPRALAEALANDGRTVVITLGSRGAAYLRGEAFGIVAPPRIDAVDATGAGDSFCAALGFAVAEGAPLPEAVRFACAAGAHAATVRGAEPGLPTRDQVLRLMQGS